MGRRSRGSSKEVQRASSLFQIDRRVGSAARRGDAPRGPELTLRRKSIKKSKLARFGEQALQKERSPGRNPGFSLVQGPKMATGMNRRPRWWVSQVWSTGLSDTWVVTGNSRTAPVIAARFNSFFKKSLWEGGLIHISDSMRRQSAVRNPARLTCSCKPLPVCWKRLASVIGLSLLIFA
jgi:hypothetical protein